MSFIKTFTGQHIDYRNVRAEQIDIEDIAVALSNICRFAGHVPEFYSVAQHAVLCSQIVPKEFAFEALMHDAAEAYCQDIPSPLKRLLPDYQRIEETVDIAIRQRFGLPNMMSTPVKYGDLVILATERRDLDLDDGSIWPVLEGIPPSDIVSVIPLKPGQAYGLFLNRFNELMGIRKCAA
ncbi:HD family hydrolase [Salmonella enterica subsp. enterica serovar Alachua]|nr:HD family hydrolase [Salmonella enterica subsp. enterica serovar Alachua]